MVNKELTLLIFSAHDTESRKKPPVFGKGTVCVVIGLRCRRRHRTIVVDVPFSVATTAFYDEQRAFVVEKYIRNDDSVIIIQRTFHIRFELGQHDSCSG